MKRDQGTSESEVISSLKKNIAMFRNVDDVVSEWINKAERTEWHALPLRKREKDWRWSNAREAELQRDLKKTSDIKQRIEQGDILLEKLGIEKCEELLLTEDGIEELERLHRTYTSSEKLGI